MSVSIQEVNPKNFNQDQTAMLGQFFQKFMEDKASKIESWGNFLNLFQHPSKRCKQGKRRKKLDDIKIGITPECKQLNQDMDVHSPSKSRHQRKPSHQRQSQAARVAAVKLVKPTGSQPPQSKAKPDPKISQRARSLTKWKEKAAQSRFFVDKKEGEIQTMETISMSGIDPVKGKKSCMLKTFE